METLHLAICDDLAQDRQKLLELLKHSPIPTDCTQFENAQQLLKKFSPNTFDLLLIDIYMEGMNGVEAVQKIREIEPNLSVAFATISTEYALESYRLSALKYLEKPVQQKDIDDLLQLVKHQKQCAPHLIIHQRGTDQKILLSDILYLEQRIHHIFIFLTDGRTIQVYGKLSTLLPQLDGTWFFCPHKSYCVNLQFVCSINDEYRCYVMTDNTKIPISRPHTSKARKIYENYLFAQTRGIL